MVRALLRDPRLPPRLLVLDLNDDYEAGVDVELVAATRDEVLDYIEDLEPGSPFSVAYRPDDESPPEAAAFLARLAWSLGDCVLVLDEAHQSCSARVGCPPEVLQVARQGRKRRVSLIVASPRPTHVDPDLRAEAYACEVYLLRLSRADDLRDVTLERGREFSDEVARLQRLHVRRVTPDGTTALVVRHRGGRRPPELRERA